jgi:superoxide dismutase, Fe-Mn family
MLGANLSAKKSTVGSRTKLKCEDNMKEFSRRKFFESSLAIGGAALGAQMLGLTPAFAQEKSEFLAFPRKYEIKPLPFNPGKLNGLSAKLLSSHHENNYGGAVKNLMKVEAEIASFPKDGNAFALTALKASEHTFRNSMILHELYFENLGGNGKVQGKAEKLINQAWGSLTKFETEFKTSGAGVGGGTGWINLCYDLRTKQPIISASGHNNQFSAYALPLLLMDVYEHAYAIDYGAQLKPYIESFYKNINWDIVNRRLETAEAVAKVLT